MITKQITFFGQPAIVGCDANCNKAWGRSQRPRIELDKNNPDDYAFLADSELGDAPRNPGTYEYNVGKPYTKSERLNKWCIRECERCTMSDPGAPLSEESLTFPDFSKRVYNLRMAPTEGENESETKKVKHDTGTAT